MEVLFLFLLILGLLVIGVPIAVALGLSSVLFLLVYSDASLASIAQTFFQAMAGHYTLLAIPFFILASSFMSTGGVARRIIRFSIALVGHLPGGLAIAGVFACMLFAALSGSSPATVVAIGTIVIAGMRQVGYSKSLLLVSLPMRERWAFSSTHYRHGGLCLCHRCVRGKNVSCRGDPWSFGGDHAHGHDLYHCQNSGLAAR